MANVLVNPDLLRWAIERSGLDEDDLRKAYPKLPDWLSGEKHPTFKQLERFAKRTKYPFGYFFLQSPPQEKIPIPDYRTKGDVPIDPPSPNLLDTIQAMQRRQNWMRDYLIEHGQGGLDFVGSIKITDDVIDVANRIHQTLGLSSNWLDDCPTWDITIRKITDAVEKNGILVFKNSVVGSQTNRSLDPEEFRGFVLSDKFAPLIFINSADTKSAQMFTMAHELVHIWLGEPGVFNLIQMMPSNDLVEQFCNKVAAEFLVPQFKIKSVWRTDRSFDDQVYEVARFFKVSPLVIARRAYDLNLIRKGAFFKFYKSNQEQWANLKKDGDKNSKGNYFTLQKFRLSNRFLSAVVQATQSGDLLYRDAYLLTNFKADSFKRISNTFTQKDSK